MGHKPVRKEAEVRGMVVYSYNAPYPPFPFTHSPILMELIFRETLFASGVVNLLPSLLVFLPDKVSSAYGIELPNANYELLLRHRAVLFGIIGGLMVYSSLARKHYEISAIAGLVSMISFVMLYVLIGKDIGIELKKVMFVDIAASTALGCAFVLYHFKSNV
jgi:heme A synthase